MAASVHGLICISSVYPFFTFSRHPYKQSWGENSAPAHTAFPALLLPALALLLPTSLVQLSTLQLSGLALQLQPSDNFQGVVWAGMPLKQLQLFDCKLLDGEEGLAAALLLLPRLEHLSSDSLRRSRRHREHMWVTNPPVRGCSSLHI